MAQRFPSVAVIGATGNLGPHIIQALLAAQPPFESITVLVRESSTTTTTKTFPPEIRIKKVDFTSLPSLTAALTGIDAVVSALPTRSAPLQHAVIDAAVAAGVRFFIPSEFGLDSTNARLLADFQNWNGKAEVANHLANLKSSSSEGDKPGMGYALIFTGLFLDWGMDPSSGAILLDPVNKKVSLWDGGETPISLTTVGTIGRAIVAVLEGKVSGKASGDGDRDREEEVVVRVKDVNLSQKKLLEIAMRVVGGDGWEVREWDTAKGVEAARENIRSGRPDLTMAFLKRAVAAGVYGSVWEDGEDDSARLGLGEGMGEEEVEGVVRGVVGI